MKKFAYPVLSLLAALLLAAATRLPQFLGGKLYPDGDECLLGLMALHWLRTGHLGVFFWGQFYGISIIEAGAIGIFYKLAGYGPLALKAAMLPLWGLGVWMLALAARRFFGTRAGWLSLLLISVCPAWAGWSIKARGGYLTAFFLFGLLLWLIAWLRDARHPPRPPRAPRPERCALTGLGMLAVLILFTQPTWGPPLLPFLPLALAGRPREGRGAVWIGLGLALMLALMGLILWRQPVAHTPPLEGYRDPLYAFCMLPWRIGHHLSGAYYLHMKMPSVPFWTRINTALWYVILLTGAGLALSQWVRRRAYGPSQAALLAILATLLYTVPMNNLYFGLRYLLPLSGLLVLIVVEHWAPVWGEDARTRRLSRALLAGLVLIGVLNQAEWRSPVDRDPRITIHFTGAEMDEAAHYLQAHHVRHVYCLDRLTPYGLMFNTGEGVIARSDLFRDRNPAYPLAVEQARLGGQPTALIGVVNQLKDLRAAALDNGMTPPPVERIGTKLFALLDPPAPLLRSLKLKIPPDTEIRAATAPVP